VRKEQILLLTAAAIGALLVWSATGRYTEVGATELPAGKSVGLVHARQPDLAAGLGKEPLKGRAAWAVVRAEKRPPLPEIPSPAALPLPWVRPVPRPGPSAEHWLKLRTAIVPVAKEKEPEKEKDEGGGAAAGADPGAANGGAANPAGAAPGPQLFDNAKPFDPAKAAKLVRMSGEEIVSVLEPSGEDKGKPDWVILEKWPKVSFWWSTLDPRNGKVIGKTELKGPEDLEGYKTVHLKSTLENCFNEERITRGVRDNDRDSLVSFAQWCMDELRIKSGDDNVQFGLDAVRKAIEVLERAKAVRADSELIRKLGSYYRAAFDLDGVARCYLEYLKAHPSEAAAQLLVGEAYERMGCWANARGLYEKAAQTGDAEARLRVGLMLEREGEYAKATETLTAIAGTSGVAPRANLALARIALRDGDLAAAASYADQAKKEPSPALNQVLGTLLYTQGKFTEAAATFGAAKEDEISTVWRSNRGLAMLASGELDGAAKEFQGCLDTDPLNMLDPLFGLGEAYQRKAETDRSNAYYETALARSPHDPWILLRVGTLRLRDGQAEKALKAGLDLLEVAPGCNEGLWLVGRAAASLGTPDWDKAVAYLRRARAKEPKNPEFLYEFARVLVLSGHVDDAIKVLDEATDVRTGYAKTDGRLVGLLAWARFLGKRPMDEVNRDLSRAKVAVLDDATKEWLAAVRTILEEWDSKRIWIDDFNRPASSVVGNGWQEQDGAHGISAALNLDKLVITSQGAKEAADKRQNATRVYRDDVGLLDLGRVKEIEASFKAQMGVETVFHMFTTGSPLADRGAPAAGARGGRTSGAELGLGCDRNGMMVLWLLGAGAKSKDQNPEIHLKDPAGNDRPWPMDDFHTVRFVRKDAQKGIWEAWFDDERILGPDGKPTFEIGAFSRQPGRAFGMGFLVDADAGSTVDVAAEYVKVTKTNK
jgi:tetratricopeptide (TPR) repeat protein